MPALSSYTSFDSTPFPLQHWGNTQNPETILVGIHGFCGACYDFTGLATQLTERSDKIGLYAYDLRGMGLDPVISRRGDIESPNYWIRDLSSLLVALKEQYPHARMVCCGESLGALIALHACAQSSAKVLCDGLIMLSPVVSVQQHITPLIQKLAAVVAKLFPEKRIPMHLLTRNQSIKVTQGSDDHLAQSMTNSWHVESFTLRLLDSIMSLIQSSPLVLQQLTHPSLIIYGGMDFFTTPQAIETFLNSAPQSQQPETAYFPEAHHLMLYDAQAPEIFRVIGDWIELSYCQ
ncbi:alpha/beta fold hydrolase [Rubritalea sp.]|uniref:alpha/beta fold hydrolase n=1 Tax=Rubritalea sp. TaxID=2109375 RepID=UPI003EF2C404